MSGSIKQLYASIYIDDNELQILVGEFYNTRFNIIRADRYDCEGVIDYKIVDKDKIANIIKNSLKESSNKIGATIKKAILVLPPYGFKRIPLRASVVPNGGILTKKDIAKALSSSLNSNVDEDVLVVNSSIVKYMINGIATRRLPENEICEEAIVDIDLLCADKQMCFDYVEVLTLAGIEVLDITLNNYAICKESVLFEQSLNQSIVLLDIANNHTYLTLLSNGAITQSEIIYDGLYSIANKVQNESGVPFDALPRLIKYNIDSNSKYPDDAVYAWNDNDVSKSISIKQLYDYTKEPIEDFVNKILTMCQSVISKGKTSFFVVNEGSKVELLISLLKEKSDCEVKAYYPDTMGIRDAVFSSIYGSFYAYKEKANLNGINVTCLDMLEYETIVNQKKIDVEGDSITTKIKKLFEQYRDKETGK